VTRRVTCLRRYWCPEMVWEHLYRQAARSAAARKGKSSNLVPRGGDKPGGGRHGQNGLPSEVGDIDCPCST
jgi:hypothetical protein